MGPALREGDDVLVDPEAYGGAEPKEGHIVVARHPYRTGVRIIKRVGRVLGNDRFILTGDNPTESTDSSIFGSLPSSHILGRVTFRLPAVRYRRKRSG
jgi:nickel-type superoxide dismutase maturation protease